MVRFMMGQGNQVHVLGPARRSSPPYHTFVFWVLCVGGKLYVQTNGPDPPSEQLPVQGAIIAVGIHYRSNMLVDGAAKTVESLTTFELGTRQGSTFAPDPNGLITREEVFYNADSLLVSGLVR